MQGGVGRSVTVVGVIVGVGATVVLTRAVCDGEVVAVVVADGSSAGSRSAR